MSSDVPVGTVWTDWHSSRDGIYWRLDREGVVCIGPSPECVEPSICSFDDLNNDPHLTRHAPGTWPPKPAPSAAFVAMREAIRAELNRHDREDSRSDDEHDALRAALALAEKEHPNA